MKKKNDVGTPMNHTEAAVQSHGTNEVPSKNSDGVSATSGNVTSNGDNDPGRKQNNVQKNASASNVYPTYSQQWQKQQEAAAARAMKKKKSIWDTGK